MKEITVQINDLLVPVPIPETLEEAAEYINTSSTKEQRNARKTLLHGMMYSGNGVSGEAAAKMLATLRAEGYLTGESK